MKKSSRRRERGSDGNSAEASGAADAELQARMQLLRSDTASATTQPTQSETALTPHGYSDIALAATQASRALAQGRSAPANGDDYIHPDLRARAEAAPQVSMMPTSVAEPAAPPVSEPAIPPPPAVVAEAIDGRKTKRELSQSKRAAQNRAAQRAFRQRKEGYIKKLEQQVRDFMEMESQFKATQTENYALREYVIHLQSRLLDTQGEYPQPPPNINLGQSGPETTENNATEQAADAARGTPLEAVAQAVANLKSAQERQFGSKPAMTADSRTADEINRQLMHVED